MLMVARWPSGKALIGVVALALIMISIDQISQRGPGPARGRQGPTTRVTFLRRLRRPDSKEDPQPGGASVAAPMANTAHASATPSPGPTPGHNLRHPGHPGIDDARSTVSCDPATTERTILLDARHEVAELGTPFCLCKHLAGNTTTSSAVGVPAPEPASQLAIGYALI